MFTVREFFRGPLVGLDRHRRNALPGDRRRILLPPRLAAASCPNAPAEGAARSRRKRHPIPLAAPVTIATRPFARHLAFLRLRPAWSAASLALTGQVRNTVAAPVTIEGA